MTAAVTRGPSALLGRCRRVTVGSVQVSIPLSFGPAVGTSAAEHLSPSFPERAAWGTADKLRAWQAEALEAYFVHEPRDFLAAATPGRRQDHLRAAPGERAAAPGA